LGPRIKNLNIKGLKTELSNGLNSSDRDEKKLFKISLSKCLNKDLEQYSNRSNGPHTNNVTEDKEQDSLHSSVRESKLVKSSSYKSLVKKQPLTDRTTIKDSKNVFLKLDSMRDKDKFPMLKLKIKAGSNNKESSNSINNFSTSASFGSTHSSSKLNKLTKLYTSSSLADLKKNEIPTPSKSSTNVIPDKNNISKFTLKFKINPMTTNPPSNSNNKEDSSIIFSSHKLTPRGAPISLSVR
jgi:hypothetical protein